MDFLNKAVSQVNDLFKSMTPGARMTAGMLLVLIVVSLVYLFAFQGRTADLYLFGGHELTTQEINAMQAAFGVENLDDYQLEGKRIRVPRSRRALYMQALTKANITPTDIESDIKNLDKYGSNLFDSEDTQKFRRSQAQQQKLARAIALRPEVDLATVNYQEVRTRGFPPDIQRKATVVVRGANNLPIERSVAQDIRATASAWFAIGVEDVALTDLHGDTYFGSEDLDGLSKEARIYNVTKARYEQQYEGKIRRCLAPIGAGVNAIVNVELDPTISSETAKVVLDPQTIPVESRSMNKSTQSKPADGGRPGTVPNEVSPNQARTLATVNNQESSSDENMEQQTSQTGHEQTHEQTAGLIPRTVTATVSFPRRYVDDVWLERDKDKKEPTTDPVKVQTEKASIEAEIIKQIEDQVVNVLPKLAAGENPFPLVKVVCYDEIPAEPIEPPSMASTAMTWFATSWQTLGLLVVGLVSLLMLRSMLRTATQPLADPQTAQMPDANFADEEDADAEEPPAVLHRRTRATGATLQEELTVMVREDPDAAANVLRTWIGDAA